MSEKTPQSIRRIVAARARGYCEYCRCSEDFATESFTVEHIKPRQAGGETVFENLAWSCFGCHGHKHTKTQTTDPETGESSPLYHPR
jgi:5-methylcytosine-specific restriction endonuclease McrA